MTEEKEILIQSLITDDVNEMPTIVQAATAIGVARQMISYYKKVSGMPYRYCAEGKKRISPELLIFSYQNGASSKGVLSSACKLGVIFICVAIYPYSKRFPSRGLKLSK